MTHAQLIQAHALLDIVHPHTDVPALRAVKDAILRFDWLDTVNGVNAAIRAPFRSSHVKAQLGEWLTQAAQERRAA